MTSMPAYPTLLRQFPARRPGTSAIIAGNVRRELKDQGLKITELSRVSQIPLKRLYGALSGHHKITIDDFFSIIDALEVTVYDLMTEATR